MLVCILFTIGTTNYVTPGCLQATGIVTPNEIVKTNIIPAKYKRQVIPWRRRIIKFDDTLTFNYLPNWLSFDRHRSVALKYPKRRGYHGLYKWVTKSNTKRYKFHLGMRSRIRLRR